MTTPRNRWPLGVTKAILPQFLIAAVVGLAVLWAIDAPVTHLVASWPKAVRLPFHYLTRLGKSDWILVPALLVALVFWVVRFVLPSEPVKAAATKIAAMGLFVLAGVGLPGLLANLLKRLIGRARPTHLDDIGFIAFHPVINNWSFQSFPSGDTTTIFAFAAVVSFLFPRLTMPAMLLAIAVGLSRIMVGMHYPSDVFGGILLGIFGAFAVRNYCADRGWLFRNADGMVVRKDFGALTGLFGRAA